MRISLYKTGIAAMLGIFGAAAALAATPATDMGALKASTGETISVTVALKLSDLAGAEERLRGFLIFRFGGPPRYIEERGHPRLRMRHAPFAIGQAARNRWVQLMNNAFAEAALPAVVP